MSEPPESTTETPSAIERVRQSHERALLTIDGVEGVGIGRDSLGNEAIVVYLRTEDVRARVPHSIEGYPVETKVTGIFEAF